MVAEPTSVAEAVRTALNLLGPRARRKYWLVVLMQISASVLDLVGVMLIGLVGVVAAASVQGTPLPDAVESVIDRMGLESIEPLALAGYIAIIAACFLISKSLVSTLLMRKIFRFLGAQQSAVSTRLTTKLLAQPLLAIEKRSSQETAYALYSAVSVTITATLGSLSIFLSEVALLGMLSVALFLISPSVTVVAFVYFALVGFILQRTLGSWSSRIGERLGSTAIRGQQHLQEAILSFREISVLGRRSLYVESIGQLWHRGGHAQGDQMFINQLPKIGYEAALVMGAVGLATWQFATTTPVEAVAMLVLFMTAGSRVLPSMLRLNSLVLSIRSGVASARVLFPIVRELESASQQPIPTYDVAKSAAAAVERYPGFIPSVELSGVWAGYSVNDPPTLANVSLFVPPGSRIAVVGTTGAGKSTLADVILGILAPSAGSVRISGLPCSQAIQDWPGAVACVPQHVAMINASVRENVAIGIPSESVDDDQVLVALEQAHLAEFLAESRQGLDTFIGERGVRLSGGQRQRLGLARALYSRPQLIVLDEATSSLDAETEMTIARAIDELGHGVTTITIAHRLAPIRHADQIIYLDGGVIRVVGTFQEVRETVPEFDHQARLMGL